MKVTSYAVARPNYYDRNGTSLLSSFAGQAAPHATTTRWTVTVAAGKKHSCEVTVAQMRRASAATVTSDRSAVITVTSGATSYAYPATGSFSNTTDVEQTALVSGYPFLYAAETMVATTSDASTGGMVFYLVASKQTIFDA